MEINILAFGIAKDILGQSKLSFEIDEGANIDTLKALLVLKHPEFDKLRSFSIAVNQEYQDDDYSLSPQDEIAIIPPVSGG